jgi:hypothetical protein
MSSGGGSSAAVQALPASTLNRPQNDLRGFVKTGSSSGSKDDPNAMDATKSIVKQTVMVGPDGNYVAKQRPGMSNEDLVAAQAQADEINSRRRSAGVTGAANVGTAGTKTVLGS